MLQTLLKSRSKLNYHATFELAPPTATINSIEKFAYKLRRHYPLASSELTLSPTGIIP